MVGAGAVAFHQADSGTFFRQADTLVPVPESKTPEQEKRDSNADLSTTEKVVIGPGTIVPGALQSNPINPCETIAGTSGLASGKTKGRFPDDDGETGTTSVERKQKTGPSRHRRVKKRKYGNSRRHRTNPGSRTGVGKESWMQCCSTTGPLTRVLGTSEQYTKSSKHRTNLFPIQEMRLNGL